MSTYSYLHRPPKQGFLDGMLDLQKPLRTVTELLERKLSTKGRDKKDGCLGFFFFFSV